MQWNLIIGLVTAGLPQILMAQLHGTYSAGHGFDATTLTFLPGQKFEYSYADCTSGNYGVGHYTFTKDILTLDFEPCSTAPDTSIHDIASAPMSQDTASITFEIADDKRQPVSYASVLWDRREGIGVTTDENGKGILHIPRKRGLHTFSIHLLGYDDVRGQIDPATDHIIHISLHSWSACIGAVSFKYKAKLVSHGLSLKSLPFGRREIYTLGPAAP
ncbi:MAG: hypothetical protein JST90_18515 [Bacteroidetes bacterium]|nr:hypothetical protein [Bacteroidota bacterium]